MMSDTNEFNKYDDALMMILVKEKSLLGFLSAIFNFLGRRTDFYHVPEGPYENMGFPPGVAEELVTKVLRKCDPKNWKSPHMGQTPTDINNEIMCSTVAQEVEIAAENDVEVVENLSNTTEQLSISDTDIKEDISPPTSESPDADKKVKNAKLIPDDYKPPVIPIQKNSDSYNGAQRENYSWSQNIMELDVIVKLPPDTKSSKNLKVTINSGDICVMCHPSGEVLIKDSLPYKIKATDSFWSISEGNLLIHLEKVQERWWNRFLNNEEPIDLSKIDCSRPLDDLPEDHVAKVRELQWNQERKLQGLPTSDEIRNIDILKKAWNAEGSPFKGQEFDPSVLNQSKFPSNQ